MLSKILVHQGHVGGGGNKFWKYLDGRVLAALSYWCWGARGTGGEINSCFCCCCIVIISRIMWLSCCWSTSICSLWNWKKISSLLQFFSISFLWREEAWDSARDFTGCKLTQTMGLWTNNCSLFMQSNN